MSQGTEGPTVSIIVPVRDGGPAFQQCLEALQRLEPPPLEVIVVDDGSTDESGSLAEAHQARLISLPTSGGPARARNVGAHAGRGDVLSAIVGLDSAELDFLQDRFDLNFREMVRVCRKYNLNVFQRISRFFS